MSAAQRITKRPVQKSAENIGIRYRSKRKILKKKTLWKNKRVIVAACVLVAVITAALAISLPGNSNDVYASGLSAGNEMSSPSGEKSLSGSGNEIAFLNQEGSDGVPVAATAGINDDPASSDTASASTVPTTAPVISDLVPGCHDARIIEIQSRLMDLNYMDSDEPSDYYGGGTKYSLELFQRKNNLQIDGLAGNDTLTKLFSPDAMPYTVKLGDKGTDVETLQERLKELKYLKSKVTGNFGTDTETAVKSFQKRNGLTSDGNIGEQTREMLFSEDAKPAAQPAPSPSPTKKPPSSPTPTPAAPDQASADALIAFAKTKLGCNYVGGGKGPNVFDCSGFVYYCLNQVGHKIGYMTARGWASCSLPKVSSMSDIKPGDIICYSPHHVAIFIGNGQMIDASSSNGKVVQRSCNTSYWHSHFICARRVF